MTGCSNFCMERTRLDFPSEVDFTRFTLQKDLFDTMGCVYRDSVNSNTWYYQGPNPVMYLIPINNAIPDGDHVFTFTATKLTPTGCFGTNEELIGNYSVTIVDDDNWKVDLKHAQGTILDSDGAHVLFEEGETSSTIIISRKDNGLGSDTTYPINVDLNFTGVAIRDSDYKVKNSNGSLLVGNWVTIPKGQTSVTLTIQAIDDMIVERLYESVEIGIVSARDPSGCTFYAIDESALKFKIKDNDTLDLQKVVFTNNLSQFCSDPDANGNTEAWGAGPHWLKGEILHRKAWTYSGMAPLDGNGAPTAGYVPVAYKSSDVMWARAKWWGNVDPNIENDLYVYFSAYIGGTSVASMPVHLIRGDDGSWVMDNESAKLSQTFAQICGQYAMYNPDLQLTWKLYVGAEGAPTARNAGISYSCLYVTYGNAGSNPPAMPSPLYHSVVHIGCKAAQGQSTEQGVFDAIWAKFAGDNICLYSVAIENGAVNDAKAGNELYYYGKVAVDPITGLQSTVARINSVGVTVGLLQHKDGCCGAWAAFLRDTLNAQGLQANLSYIGGLMGPFDRSGQDAYHKLLCADSSIGIHHNQIPLENKWINHWIVKYDNSYYDSSYGISYSGKTDIIQSFSYDYQLSSQNIGTMQNRPGSEYNPTIHLSWITLIDY